MARYIVIFILSNIFFFSAIPMPKYFDYALIVFLFLMDIFIVYVKKRSLDYAFLKWYSLFIFFCVLSLLWSISPFFSLFQILVRIPPNFLLGIFITSYVKNNDQLKDILVAFYISAIIFFLYVATLIDFSMLSDTRVGAAIQDEEIADKMNSNYIAGRLVFAFYVGFFLFWKLQKSKNFLKYFHLLFSLLIVYVVLISGSRTSLGVLLLPPLIYYISKNKNVLKTFLFVSVFAAIVFVVIMKIPSFYEILGSRIEDAFNVMAGKDTGHEDVSRLALITYGLDWFQSKPLFGYGINCYRILSDNTVLFAGRRIYAHNNYIELLVDVGLIGVFIYYYAYFFFCKNLKFMKTKGLATVLKILIVVLLFTDFFWVGYYNRLSQFVVCIAFVVIKLSKSNISYETS